MTTSTTSLYTIPGNVTVSANNLTTLYNATGGNVVTANVPDRNFTTLYTQQSDTRPTVPYGNANVEAFLNAGSDVGGNQVQNIVMFGNVTSAGGASFAGNVIVANLSVTGQSNFGPVGNVHITGGLLNYVLQTDGAGNLSWVAQPGSPTVNAVDYIHFDVVANANNQTFTNSNLSAYASNVNMNVMKNGVNIEPTLYVKTNSTTIQINIPLNTGDSIDILAAASGGSGSGGSPGGNLTSVQYNGGSVLSGNNSFTFDQANSRLTVGNVSTGNINAGNITMSAKSNLGPVGNVIITGGSNGQYLQTDGAGNLAWVSGTSNTATSVNANIANVIIFGGSNGQSLTTDGNGVLSWTSINSANSNYANFAGTAFSVSAGNIVGVVNLANYATVANSVAGANVSGFVSSANFATLSTYASIANSVAGANVTGTVANATYAITAGLANSATVANSANSVDGANVTGTVANATFATTAGTANSATVANSANSVAGANVTGTVANATYAVTAGTANSATVANSANSVAGANVTGTVANAAFATVAGTANSVSVSNVVGIGNIAVLNLTGSSSNVLYGNGIFAPSSGGIPGGSNTQFQYNNSGSFGGVSGLTFNGTIITANLGNLQLNLFQEKVYAIGSVSGPITPDFNNGSIQTMTLTGNITMNTLGNAIAGRSMTLIITQGGSGNYTLNSTMRFAGAYKTLSTAVNARDIISVFYDGTAYYAALTKGFA